MSISVLVKAVALHCFTDYFTKDRNFLFIVSKERQIFYDAKHWNFIFNPPFLNVNVLMCLCSCVLTFYLSVLLR